jgi:hypothetical protein
MKMKKNVLRLLGVAIAIGLLFAASEVRAQPVTCSGGQFIVNFTGKSAGPQAGQVTWNYLIMANQTALSSVKSAAIIIPRPVTPFNVPASTSQQPLNFCMATDNNTKINTGNCGGFPVNILTLEKSGSNLTAKIVTTSDVTQDVVSMNIVTGPGSSTTCVGFDANNQPTGIAGPGNVGDPFQPLSITENVVAAGGKCSVQLNYNSKGQLISLSNPVSTNPSDTSIQCQVANPNSVLVNGAPLRNNTGRSGITFGNGTSTCYGPPVPSTPWCVCTTAPCP